MHPLRIGILESFSLGLEHFKTAEEAYKVADKYIKHQRELVPCIAEEHPDQVMGHPAADLFWFADCKGKPSSCMGPLNSGATAAVS